MDERINRLSKELLIFDNIQDTQEGLISFLTLVLREKAIVLGSSHSQPDSHED